MLHDPKIEARIAEEIFYGSLEPWQRAYLNAAELIKRGWAQGAWISGMMEPVPKYCAVGAASKVWIGSAYHNGNKAISKLLVPLAQWIDPDVNINDHDWILGTVIDWNDGTSKDTVVRGFQLVALG